MCKFFCGIIPLPYSTNNQNYYNKDLPAKAKGKVNINLSNIPSGKYKMEIYKVGYRVNDVYTNFVDMGKPAQLNKQQVEKLKLQNDGSPIATQIINVTSTSKFKKELDIRENDVYLVNLIKQ